MNVISAGSRGYFVQLLQRLLNKAGASPRLRPDGDWGPRTDAAFGRAVGATSTNVQGLQTNAVIWRNLGLTVELDHPVQLHPQPTDMTCWSASMTMLTGLAQSMGSGSGTTGMDGSLDPSDANVAAFARSHGKRIVSSHQSLAVPTLISILRNGPAMICGWGPNQRRPDGTHAPAWGHVSVLSGIWSTGDGDGMTTLFRVHDPWPPHTGRVWYDFYSGQPGGTMDYARFGDVILQ